MDCALATGLMASLASSEAPALQGMERVFAVTTALPGLVTHDPPPPRA